MNRAPEHKKKCSIALVGYALLAGVLSTSVMAADVAYRDEYDRHIRQSSEIGSMAGEFGDRIDLSSGSLEILKTDIDIPGIGPTVRVGRRYRPSDIYGRGHFNYWDMDLPHVHGTFAKIVGGGGWPGWGSAGTRCSQFTAPPDVAYQGGSFSTDEYWSGSFLYLPGGGEQELLERGNALVPSDGATYPIVTKENAAVRCVALAATSEPGSTGEGFEVVGSDGTIYTLNQLVSRLERGLVKSDPSPMSSSSSASTSSETSQKAIPQPSLAPVNYILPRQEILLFPTRIKDRFGNTVTYTWSATNPWQLQRIEAADGRHLDFTYVGTTDNRVSTVTDGSRTWTYAYSAVAGPTDNPDTLTLPDGSVWSYRLARLSYAASRTQGGSSCDALEPSTGTYAGTITSPSGATLALAMGSVKFGRSWVQRECVAQLNDAEYAREPYLFVGFAVTSKKITGPGLPAAGLSWGYSYGPPNHCWNPNTGVTPGPGAVLCTSTQPTVRTVLVTAPDGVVTRHTFGNRSEPDPGLLLQANEGLLLTEEAGWNGTSAVRAVTLTYADPEAAPYAAFAGNSYRNIGDYDITSKPRPLQKRVTIQQGRTFTWEVAAGCSGYPACFDQYARPTKVVKTSSP